MKWLILDCNYLCYRSFYSTGHLTHNDIVTGVLFGFFREIIDLQELYGVDGLVFCFDSRTSLRKEEYPMYKANRKSHDTEEEPEEAKKTWAEFHLQVTQLRRDYLPEIGYNNILCQRGLEADDMVAAAVNSLGVKDRAVIVSADQDLYQLLTPSVSMWQPQKRTLVTYKSFMRTWGIRPQQWADVKAFSGCKSDNIEGIKGVGELTAARWLLGQLKENSKAYDRICKGMEIYIRNKPIVTLPFTETRPVQLVPDTISADAWQRITKTLGMKSLGERSISTQEPANGGRRLRTTRYGKGS